ncbi:hypothetical protein ANCCEY_00235 [Ancylostoma ceylanicum]|uniref:Uncharacterized protein n=1 Tax=Ancylostoma ceylanicum TaxID=53326 RepID=A0A0D6MDH4_9BILA|nr:hypothetical protein ANCCEY_00235 [Ancylostoma ceylanicum]
MVNQRKFYFGAAAADVVHAVHQSVLHLALALALAPVPAPALRLAYHCVLAPVHHLAYHLAHHLCHNVCRDTLGMIPFF